MQQHASKKKKSMWLVLCLDCSVSDYACAINQAALLQKSDIILRAEPGPAAAGTLSANRPYARADPPHFNKAPRKLILQVILTDQHRRTFCVSFNQPLWWPMVNDGKHTCRIKSDGLDIVKAKGNNPASDKAKAGTALVLNKR